MTGRHEQITIDDDDTTIQIQVLMHIICMHSTCTVDDGLLCSRQCMHAVVGYCANVCTPARLVECVHP